MRRIWIGLGIVVGLLLTFVVVVYVLVGSIDWNRYKGPVANAVHGATGRELDLSGDLSIVFGWSPGISVEDVTFANAEWGSQPVMAHAERVVVQLELIPLLSGHADVDHIELQGVELLLETNADGVTNWTFESAESPPDEAEDHESSAFISEIRSLAIVESTLRIRDLGANSERTISFDRLEAHDQEGGMSLALDARVDGEPLQLSGSTTRIGAMIAGGPIDFDLDLVTGRAKSSFEGQYDGSVEPTTFTLALDSKGEDVAGWGTLAGVELPHLGAYRLAARITGKGDLVEIRNLEIGVGDSQIGGEVDLDLGGERPRIRAKLNGSELDLADFQEPSPETPAVEESPAVDAPVFSDEPLPWDVLQSVDGQLTLSADRLRAGALQLEKLDLDLELEKGRLKADPVTFRIAEGEAKVSLELDSKGKPPRLTIAGSVEEIATSKFLRGQSGDALDGGPADLRVDLSSRGRSIAAIAGALSGSIVLDMSEVRVKNAVAGLAMADIRSMLLGRDDVRVVEIDCVFADLEFQDGVGHPKGLVIDLPSVAVFGSGSVDLGEETLDLRFDREAKSLSASQAMPPFKIRGTLADPKTSVDATRLAGRVADLGAEVLTGDLILDWKHWPKGCPELLAAYEKAKSEPSEAEKAVRKGGEKAVDALERLLRKKD